MTPNATPIEILPLETTADFVAVDDDNVYWSSFGSPGVIGQYTKASSQQPTLIATNEELPTALTVVDKTAYWARYEAGGIVFFFVNAAGSPKEIVHSDLHPSFIAVDGPDVFWSWRGEKELGGVATVAANGVTSVLANGQSAPLAIALDKANVYWIGADGSVHSVARSGLDAEVPIAPPEGALDFAEIRVDDTHVYWTGGGTDTCPGAERCTCGGNLCAGKIWRAEKPSGTPEVFWENGSQGAGLGAHSLILDGDAVYWATRQRLLRKPKASR